MEFFYSFVHVLFKVALGGLSINLVGRALSQAAALGVLGWRDSLFWAALAVVSYQVVLYPWLLDPLRKLPSVFVGDVRILLPVTDVPRGDQALAWVVQHEGSDLLRISMGGVSSALMPISATALRDVLSVNADDFEKPLSGRNYLSRLLGYGLILSEGPDHARQRRTLASSFRVQTIRRLHGLMARKTDIMVQGMKQAMQKDGHCEINDWASRVTLDIIGLTLMSTDFDSLQDANQEVHEAFAQVTAASPGQTLHFLLGTFLPKAVVAALPTKTNRMINENAGLIRKMCEASLDAFRQTDPTTSAEILRTISEDPGTSPREIVDQMLTFLGAGHETTATSIAWAVHLLTLPQHMRYQQLIREEVREALQENPEKDVARMLEILPWLNAVCEETLRLFPPVTSTARKAIRTTNVAGTVVPKGTMLFLFPWGINRSPKAWGGRMAGEFVPDRWVDHLPSGQVRLNKHGGAASNFNNLTFLHGDRSCIGKDFAKAELRCILARLVQEFNMSRLAGDDLKARPSGSLTIKPEGGLYVRLELIDAS